MPVLHLKPVCQTLECPACNDQIFKGALFHDPALSHYQNPIGIFHICHAMGHD